MTYTALCEFNSRYQYHCANDFKVFGCTVFHHRCYCKLIDGFFKLFVFFFAEKQMWKKIDLQSTLSISNLSFSRPFFFGSFSNLPFYKPFASSNFRTFSLVPREFDITSVESISKHFHRLQGKNSLGLGHRKHQLYIMETLNYHPMEHKMKVQIKNDSSIKSENYRRISKFIIDDRTKFFFLLSHSFVQLRLGRGSIREADLENL